MFEELSQIIVDKNFLTQRENILTYFAPKIKTKVTFLKVGIANLKIYSAKQHIQHPFTLIKTLSF